MRTLLKYTRERFVRINTDICSINTCEVASTSPIIGRFYVRRWESQGDMYRFYTKNFRERLYTYASPCIEYRYDSNTIWRRNVIELFIDGDTISVQPKGMVKCITIKTC